MVIRSTAPTRLERAPLIYFIAQVRFADILALERHVPAIQDELRKSGWPMFRNSVVQGLRLDQNGVAAFDNRQIWHFENVDATSGIVLTQDSVALHTTTYDCFGTMLPPFTKALARIHAILGIDVLQRCGLRYVDVIHPGAGESFLTYLKPEIVGLSGADFGVTPQMQSSAFSGMTESGTLVVRFATNAFPNVMPPDLMPVGLKLNIPLGEGESVGTLDFDHYAELKESFVLGRAQATLEQLHDGISRAFVACVTPKAFELWGEQRG